MREKGSGCLVKRGSVWYARWTVDGKIYQRSAKTSDRKEALRKLAEYTRPFKAETEMERLKALAARLEAVELEAAEFDELPDTPLEKGLEIYLKSPDVQMLAEGSVSTYEKFWNGFVKFCRARGLKRLKDVGRREAEAFLESWKGKSASRYNGTLALLLRMWKEWKSKSKHIAFRENPFEGYRYKRSDPVYRRAFTAQELSRLREAAEGEMYVLIAVGFYTGLRLSDCCCLKWSEIDFGSGTIRLIPRKTKRLGKFVTIPVHRALYGILAGLSKTAETDYVLPRARKEYLEGSIHKRLGELFSAAGLERRETVDGKPRTVLSFHSLRHTFVSMASNSGVPIDVVQTLVGHLSPEMTRRYSHIAVSSLEKAVGKLPEIGFENGPGTSRPQDDYSYVRIRRSVLEALDATPERILKDYAANHGSKQPREAILSSSCISSSSGI